MAGPNALRVVSELTGNTHSRGSIRRRVRRFFMSPLPVVPSARVKQSMVATALPENAASFAARSINPRSLTDSFYGEVTAGLAPPRLAAGWAVAEPTFQ